MIHPRPIFNYPTVCAVEFESRIPGYLSSVRLRHQWAHLQILTGGPLSFVVTCAPLVFVHCYSLVAAPPVYCTHWSLSSLQVIVGSSFFILLLLNIFQVFDFVTSGPTSKY